MRCFPLFSRPALFLAALLVVLSPALCLGQGNLTDDQKIEKLYSAYVVDKIEQFPLVRDLSAFEAMEDYEAGKAVFVDVRPESECLISMLPGAILSKDFLADPKKFQAKKVILYSYMGVNSGLAGVEMKKKGLSIYNLTGGILAWVHEGGKLFHDSKESKKIFYSNPQWPWAPAAYELVK